MDPAPTMICNQADFENQLGLGEDLNGHPQHEHSYFDQVYNATKFHRIEHTLVMSYTLEDGPPQVRRKACDLCFIKKIKCDMVEPECSNCLLYQAKCHTSPIRSRAKPPQPQPASHNKAKPKEFVVNMSARIEKIEEQLQQVIQNTERPNESASIEIRRSDSNVSSNNRSTISDDRIPIWRFYPVKPKLYYGPSDTNLYLPPLDDILPIIDGYFNNRNRASPLFSQTDFMRLVTRWYSKNHKRDRPTWAAILVVIAMGLRSRTRGDTVIASHPENSDLLDYCMRNAQSVMPELVMRDEDLLGVQVIISLAILFRNSGDIRPATALVGMAVNLAHRMQLHSDSRAQLATHEESQQISRVFWMLYILDRDVCLRSKTPLTLPDAEIDVALPPTISFDGMGVITTNDGREKLGIFKLQLVLAQISGKIYNLLYSSRSAIIGRSEREQRVTELQTMLDEWYNEIPPAFQLDRVAETVNDADLAEITQLYNSYVMCLVSTHGIYSIQAEWMQRVNALSKAAIQDFTIAIQGPRIKSFIHILSPPLRSGWKHCLKSSRDFMKLFIATNPTDSFLWNCGCAYTSSLIILLANIIISPLNPAMYLDMHTATKSIEIFEQVDTLKQSEAHEALHRVIKDLHKSALLIVECNELSQNHEADNLLAEGNTVRDDDIFARENGFLEFDYDEYQIEESLGTSSMASTFM